MDSSDHRPIRSGASAPDGPAVEKWLGSDVAVRRGRLLNLRPHLPYFRRVPLGLTQPGRTRSRLNGRLDLIVRAPVAGDPDFVPVGTVSRNYRLIQHLEVYESAMRALDDSGVDVTRVTYRLRLTELGERMELGLMLPREYGLDPGDGHPMALQVICINSVDGSTRLRAIVGWFRFVCSNGLVVGDTRLNVRRRHAHGISLRELEGAICEAVADSPDDREIVKGWRGIPLEKGRLQAWVDGPVTKSWGPVAAVRTLQIATTGWDVQVTGIRAGLSASQQRWRRTRQVPGTPLSAQTVFDAAQILAWLAKERKELAEQMEWREEIPRLIGHLTSGLG